jgi:hypothetical protein
MSPKSHLHEDRESPRVKLGGSVLAVVLLENGRQVRAKLHQLSGSGGVMHLEKPLDEGIIVEAIFHVDSVYRLKCELLFPMWATNGYLQPFRFHELPEADAQRLQTTLQKLL